MNSGPGRRPQSRKAARRTAVEAEPGIPSVKSGIIAPYDAALFAVSGATRPAISTLPKFAEFLETERSVE